MGIYSDLLRNLAPVVNKEPRCDLLTGRSFAAVRLGSGEIGTAMDYSRYGSDATPAVVRETTTTVAELLDGFPAREDRGRLAAQVACAIALSRRNYEPARLAAAGIALETISYAEERRLPLDGFVCGRIVKALGEASVVGVVGFGGLMEMFASLPQIERVHVFDLDIPWRRDRLQTTIGRLNSEFGRQVIVLHPADELGDMARSELQLVQVTGSMLSNGTAEHVLGDVGRLPLMVTGPTAAINPEHWFSLGARLVSTELRAPSFWRAYLFDDHLYDFETEYAERTYLWRGEVGA